MTETNQVHDVAKRHLAPYGRWDRVDNAAHLGWPDVDYTLFGVHGYCEEKIIPASGRCPDHFTLEQLMWGEREVALGGRWFLLGRQAMAHNRIATWILYDAPGARVWFEGDAERWLFRTIGDFPTRQVLDRLAPRELRRGLTFSAKGAI